MRSRLVVAVTVRCLYSNATGFGLFMRRFVPNNAQKRAQCAASKRVTFFVFRHFLGSFPRFSIFCSVLLLFLPKHSAIVPGIGAAWRQATTKCLECDHNYRLSWARGVVKRKMPKMRGKRPTGAGRTAIGGIAMPGGAPILALRQARVSTSLENCHSTAVSRAPKTLAIPAIVLVSA